MDNFAFLLPAILSAFGVTFLIVARHEPRAAPVWGAGYLCAALAFSIAAMPDVVPVEIKALTADTLFLVATSLYGEALLRQFRRRLPIWPRVGLIAAGGLGSVVAIFVIGSPTVDLAVNDITTTLCLVIPAFACLRRAKRGVERVLVGLVLAVAADSVVRNVVMMALNANPGTFENFLSTPYAFAMQATSTIAGMLMALAALATVTLEVIGRYKDVAERDPLTGLLNRRGFDRLTGQTLVEGAILVCDIDHFKAVNDRYGHAIGDAVIARVAAVLARRQPETAALARFGGEEFVLFLPNLPLQAATGAAHALHAALGATDWSETGSGPITASFGVAATRSGDHGLAEVVARADRALYAAKRAGRNRVVADGERPVETWSTPMRSFG